MDEYPAYTLGHNIPLLVTFGIPPRSGEELSISPELKEQATLLRSNLPPLEGELAQALRQHVEARDAWDLPWNNRDSARKYKFKVRVASRVCWDPAFAVVPSQADHRNSRICSLPDAQGYPKTLKLHHSLPPLCIHPSRP